MKCDYYSIPQRSVLSQQRKPHTRSEFSAEAQSLIFDDECHLRLYLVTTTPSSQTPAARMGQPIPWRMLRILSKGVFPLSTLKQVKSKQKETAMAPQQKHAHFFEWTWLWSEHHSQAWGAIWCSQNTGPMWSMSSWTLDRRQSLVPQRRPEREILSKEPPGDLEVEEVVEENKHAPFYILKNILDLWIWRDWPRPEPVLEQAMET